MTWGNGRDGRQPRWVSHSHLDQVRFAILVKTENGNLLLFPKLTFSLHVRNKLGRVWHGRPYMTQLGRILQRQVCPCMFHRTEVLWCDEGRRVAWGGLQRPTTCLELHHRAVGVVGVWSDMALLMVLAALAALRATGYRTRRGCWKRSDGRARGAGFNWEGINVSQTVARRERSSGLLGQARYIHAIDGSMARLTLSPMLQENKTKHLAVL